MAAALKIQGIIRILEGTYEFLTENLDQAIFCIITIVVTILVTYYFYRSGKPKFNINDYFFTCKKTKDISPKEDFGIEKYHDYYYAGRSDEQITKFLNENKRVLIIGRPSAGKTRAAFEAIKEYSDYYIYMPYPKRTDISQISNKEIQKKAVLFFDDLNKFTGKFLYHELLKKFGDACSDLKIIATCRTGKEEAEVIKDEETARFAASFSKVKLPEDITKQEGKAIAKEVGIDFSPSQFDGTVGSVLLGLDAMSMRYENLREQERILLRLIKILADGGTYLIEKNILKRLFFHWTKDERIELYQTFDSSLQQLGEGSFLKFLNDKGNLVMPSYDPYLEITRYEVSDNDLLRMEELFYDLKYINGLLNLGNSFINKNKHQYGIDCFCKSIELDKKNAIAFFSRGRIYAEIGEYDKAISDFNEAIRINPSYVEAYCARGLIYYSLGEHDKAISDFNEAIRMNPNCVEAYLNRAVVYDKLGKHDKAISDLNEAIRINPSYAEAYCARGLIYSLLNEYNEAISDFNEAIRINPSYAEAYRLQGVAHYNLRQYEKALSDYGKAIGIDPDYVEAYYNRGKVYDVLNKFHEAISDYENAIRVNPKYARAHRNLGLSYCKIEKYRDATKSLKYAAMLFLQKKNTEDAIETLFYCFELQDKIQNDDVIFSGLTLYLWLEKKMCTMVAVDPHLRDLQKAILDSDKIKISRLEGEIKTEDLLTLLSFLR